MRRRSRRGEEERIGSMKDRKEKEEAEGGRRKKSNYEGAEEKR